MKILWCLSLREIGSFHLAPLFSLVLIFPHLALLIDASNAARRCCSPIARRGELMNDCLSIFHAGPQIDMPLFEIWLSPTFYFYYIKLSSLLLFCHDFRNTIQKHIYASAKYCCRQRFKHVQLRCSRGQQFEIWCADARRRSLRSARYPPHAAGPVMMTLPLATLIWWDMLGLCRWVADAFSALHATKQWRGTTIRH